MSDFTVFLDTARDWAIRTDWSDSLVTSFVRTAESQLSRQLRVKEMIIIADAQVAASRVKLPLNWRELDFVKINNGLPIPYMAIDNFNWKAEGWKCSYTIIGDTIQFGSDIPTPDGLPVEISYYAATPPFTGANTWLQTYYFDIFLQKVLSVGQLYAKQVEAAVATSAYVDGLVAAANDEHKISNFSGSPLKRARTGRRLG